MEKYPKKMSRKTFKQLDDSAVRAFNELLRGHISARVLTMT